MGERGTRKFWGWGFEEEAPGPDELARVRMLAGARFGSELPDPRPAPRIEDIHLRAPRVELPSAIEPLVSTSDFDRASHTYGKAYRDVVRGLDGDFRGAPDAVARPRDEDELARLLEWCSAERIVAIPYGGGTSVVGGVEAPPDAPRVVSLDLGRFDRVLEIDPVSRAARIQGGILGPALEDGLRPHGFTLRHFPQSFEFSTLGGWLATRAGGHYATVLTHIDDMVESLRVVTPSGTLESRRLPGSGAGPSPDRMFLGSEGILGIITEAWMRIHGATDLSRLGFDLYPDFGSGARAVRAHSLRAASTPANCRLLDPIEALLNGAGDGNALLILGFESADHPLDPWLARGLEIARDHGGTVLSQKVGADTKPSGDLSGDAAGAWRRSFLRAPYLRDALVAMGLITETFETAVTWDAFESFHASVTGAVREALERVTGGGEVTCRFTHVYPDGAAPYFTVLAPARPGSAVAQWDEIKAAAGEAILAAGAITHHHAVGRDHRPWYDRQRPEAFARALRATKRELDPAGILNPGVLVDP